MKKLGFFVVVACVVIVATTQRSTPASIRGPTLSKGTPSLHSTHQLIRISQRDCQQYNSTAECNEWAMATCSAAAMTEIANYYDGPGQYRIHDLLAIESRIGEITPQLGLLEDAGIARTMAFFGFHTSWGHGRSLDHIMQLANEGTPVIVSFPPWLYAGGHLVVVTGGNGHKVFLADSSIWNRHSLSRQQFQQWWGGFSAVVIPQRRQV